MDSVNARVDSGEPAPGGAGRARAGGSGDPPARGKLDRGSSLGPGVAGPRIMAYVPPAAILALQQVLYPLPLGVWVRGVLVGGVTALIALGMALIYRSNRIVNFAQGDLGALPAVLASCCSPAGGGATRWPSPRAAVAAVRARRHGGARGHPPLLPGPPAGAHRGHDRPRAAARRHRRVPPPVVRDRGQLPRPAHRGPLRRPLRDRRHDLPRQQRRGVRGHPAHGARARRLPPRHQARHRHPRLGRPGRPGGPPRRAGQAAADPGVGRRRPARLRRHVHAGRHPRPARRLACSASGSSCAP